MRWWRRTLTLALSRYTGRGEKRGTVPAHRERE
jgi:hypothetical protein